MGEIMAVSFGRGLQKYSTNIRHGAMGLYLWLFVICSYMLGVLCIAAKNESSDAWVKLLWANIPHMREVRGERIEGIKSDPS